MKAVVTRLRTEAAFLNKNSTLLYLHCILNTLITILTSGMFEYVMERGSCISTRKRNDNIRITLEVEVMMK
jgi:hypothetical protein